MKRVYPIEDYCIGCHLCEVACAVAHSRSGDIIRAYKVEGTRPRNVVEEALPVTLSVNCRHCDEPSCVAACISGALRKQPSGPVTYDEVKCVGCWSCVMACPHGAVRPDAGRMKIIKCDLCPGRETPACVSACPNRALVYEERK
ncbi:MAG: 4Fe-4S dicluster domain-containing protein [Pseudomonadota bacterium]